ncbi:MAG: SDR family NAD(P)-dependent oxidoreductase [Candidatus Binatia bacterium]
MDTQRESYVALVTGASRGAGRGIAIGLGQKGATVYVTGRTTKPGEAPLPGTIYETADLVTAAGGRGIPVRCDHGKDEEIAALFAQVEREAGRLDVLVNNVAVIHDDVIRPGPFWEKSIDLANIISIGLRCHYIASFHAAPMMVRDGRGLIVFTSSYGSVCYMHGPAYGAQKAGVDKLAADMAVDLRDRHVAAVSIWMGPLQTARFERALQQRPEQYERFAELVETPEFTGFLIDALFRDPNLMAVSGKTLIGADLGMQYGIKDAGGKQPPSYRAVLGEPREPHPAIVL